MSISDIKLNKLIAVAEDLAFKSGSTQGYTKILSTLLSRLGDLSQPALRLFSQKFKRPFDIDQHNRMMKEVGLDLEVLYEEFYDQALQSLRYVDKNDLLLRRIGQEADKANDELVNQLLTIQGITGFFFGAFDNFKDTSKVDLISTTAEIDLGTQSIRIPRSMGSTNRVDLAPLYSIQQAPFVVTSPTTIVSNRTVPGAWYNNAFDDLTSAWQQEIVTSGDTSITGYFIFPLTTDGSLVSLSSIYIDPLSRTSIPITVSYSTDGVNFSLLQTPSPTTLTTSSLRIAGTAIQASHLKMQLTNASPDRHEIDGTNVFYIGIKSIAVFMEGFQLSGTLVSEALSPDNPELISTIDKVSITVEEDLPPGTGIEYYIAPAGSTQFVQISPINNVREDLPVVVDYDKISTTPAYSNIRTISGTTPYVFSDGNNKRNGVSFFAPYTFPATPIFNSVSIRRALDAWRIVSKTGVPQTNVESNNYIVFTSNDNSQELYINVDNELVRDSVSSVQGSTTVIVPEFPVLVAPAFRLFSTTGPDPQRPDYLIGSLILRPSGTGSRMIPISFPSATVTSVIVSTNLVSSVGNKALVLSGKALSTVFPIRRIDGQSVKLSYTYGSTSINQVFQILSVTDSPVSNSTIIILADPNDVLRDAISGVVATFQSLDITQDITAVAERGVTLSAQVEILPSDRLLMSYRRSLTDSDALLLDSVVVTDKVNGSTVFKQGVDYSINPITRTIYRDPNGSITQTGSSISVRASFQYTTMHSNLYSYETYITVPGSELLRIDIVNPTSQDGESAYVYDNSGVVDLTTANTITLSPGTHRIGVVSTTHLAPSGSLDTNSLIYKIVNLKNSVGDSVFNPGMYFSSQEGFVAGMTQLNLPRLVNSVRAGDHSFFAVDGTSLVLNFNPSLGEDVLYLVPGAAAVSASEQFAIGYNVLPDAAIPITQVVFKAILKRVAGSTPEVTPTLYSYNIRMAHV